MNTKTDADLINELCDALRKHEQDIITNMCAAQALRDEYGYGFATPGIESLLTKANTAAQNRNRTWARIDAILAEMNRDSEAAR